MSEVLVTIELHPDSMKALATLNKIGGTRLRGTPLQKLVTFTNKLNKLAVSAYQSKVPYDTGELRDHIVVIERATQKTPYASMGIQDGGHSGRGKSKSISTLVSMLDSGKGEKGQALHFKAGSEPVPPFRGVGGGSVTSTAGWKDKAFAAYMNQERRLLSQLVF